MLHMVGLFYMSTMLNIPHFTRVEFIVSYVSRCRTLLLFVRCRCDCLICCLVIIYVAYHDFRVETSLVIIVRSSISSFQRVNVWLVRRCTSGIYGINASVRGRELVIMYFIHSVVVSTSKLTNCWLALQRNSYELVWYYIIAGALCILVWDRISLSRMLIVLGTHHDGVLSL